MYKVIKHFIDLHDNDHSYNEGDIFPREGVDVSKERIEELAGSNNKQHTPLIELVEEDPDNTAGTAIYFLIPRQFLPAQILQKKHQKPVRRKQRVRCRKTKSWQSRRSV